MAKNKKTAEINKGITPDTVFQVTDRILLSEGESGIITVMEKQDHKIQNALRSLKFRIPEYRKTELDEYGSFVFKNLDGNITVEQLGLELKEHFGPAVEPLYERLALYLQYLERTAEYIKRAPQSEN